MRDYSWLRGYPDAQINKLKERAASQVAFGNIPLWQRLVMGVALAIPLLASLIVTVGVFQRASQVEQFMALVGCGIGVAIWALSREARRRREFLQAVLAEQARRQD